jgi:hypothetical protein
MNMRFKYIITAIVLTILFPIVTLAQSSMTDEQVMTFVVQEQKAGTSQSQIVTKLMQQGVDISQIRRIRQKYERQEQRGLVLGMSPTLLLITSRLAYAKQMAKRRQKKKTIQIPGLKTRMPLTLMMRMTTNIN